MAASLAQQAGLADQTGWCPVDPVTFESSLQRDIHLVGDAIGAGAMPKSASAANSQAKACASAIAAGLTGVDRAQPGLSNACYTVLAPDDAVSNAVGFKVAGGKIAVADILISRLEESAAVRAKTARAANS